MTEPSTHRRPSFATSAATTFGTNALTAVLSFVSVLVVARALGPQGRGEVAFLIAIGLLTSHLAALSLQEAKANFAGAEPHLRPSLATNAVAFTLVLSAVAVVALIALVTVFPAVAGEIDLDLIWIPIVAVPAVILKLYLNFLVQADYAFTVTNVAWLLGPATTATLNVALVAVDRLSVTTAGVAWVAGQALGAATLVWYVSRHAGFGRPDLPLARRTLAFGLKAHSGRVLAIGNYRADQWLVGAIAGSRELGLYSVAMAWADMLFYLSGVLVLVQRPDLVRASAKEAAKRAARVLRVALMLTGPVCLVLVLAAPILCVVTFGEDFRGAVDDLRMLALGGFGIVTLDLVGNALTAQRRPLLTAAATAVAFLVMLTLDLILIPHWGGLGAATAATVGWMAGGLAAGFLFLRAFHQPATELVPRGADIAWLGSRLRGFRSSRRAGSRDEPHE